MPKQSSCVTRSTVPRLREHTPHVGHQGAGTLERWNVIIQAAVVIGHTRLRRTRKASCSFATAWQAAQDYRLLRTAVDSTAQNFR